MPARVTARRTFEVIVDMIKERVFSGAYGPGDRLPAERESAAMLGVGRPAVREAYRALELIGIVEIRRGKHGGAFITQRDRQTVTETLSDLIRLRQVNLSELTEARMVLEKHVAELAMFRIGPDGLAQLRACIGIAIDQSRRVITATAENVRFHMLLGEMSGNPVLSMMLGSTLDLLQMIIGAVAVGPDVSLANAEEHYRIVEALQSRDTARLRAVLGDHISRSNSELMRLAKGSPLLAAAQVREQRDADSSTGRSTLDSESRLNDGGDAWGTRASSRSG